VKEALPFAYQHQVGKAVPYAPYAAKIFAYRTDDPCNTGRTCSFQQRAQHNRRRLEHLMPKHSILAVLLAIVCMFSASVWASDWCDVRMLRASDETAAPADCAATPQVYLVPQNQHRAQHCVPPLTWDEGLASQATAWARRCNFVHSFRSGVGENLYFQRPSMKDPRQGIDAWYGEVRAHKYDAAQYSPTSGHFTQLIWKGTTRVGCGSAICPGLKGGGIMMVCRYAPQGNMTTNGVWQGPTNVPRPCK
jgi:hypothetical protein